MLSSEEDDEDLSVVVIFLVGDIVGVEDGTYVGETDGDSVGLEDGKYIGETDGDVEGLSVVGDVVGCAVSSE